MPDEFIVAFGHGMIRARLTPGRFMAGPQRAMELPFPPQKRRHDDMANAARLLPVLGLVLVFASGCATDQRVLDSLQRLIDTANDELAQYRGDDDDAVTPSEKSYTLIAVGSAHHQLVVPIVPGSEFTFIDIDNWGFWAVEAGDEITRDFPSLFRAQIDARGTVQHSGNNNDVAWATSVTGIRSGSNPGFTARWVGKTRAIESSSFLLLEGAAELAFESPTNTVDISLKDFKYGEHEDAIDQDSDDYPDLTWSDIPVSHGAFRYDPPDTRDHRVSGAFYGKNHEGVAGEFSSAGLKGVYGALGEVMESIEPPTPDDPTGGTSMGE